MKADNWIDVNVQPPQCGQDVIFIVESRDEHYNGRMLGGRYHHREGFQNPHEFSVPGIGFMAKLWQPMPTHPSGFIGIPLSPDVVTKCGFELVSDMGDQSYYVHRENKDWYVGFDHDDIEFGSYKSPGQIGVLLHDSPQLQYLHQLQNLFSALTGIELKIEL